MQNNTNFILFYLNYFIKLLYFYIFVDFKTILHILFVNYIILFFN